jgi:histone H1/5
MPAKAKAAAPKHPKYIEMVKEAIAATGKPVRGASRKAIVKYLEAKYGKVLGKIFKTALRLALKGAAAKGTLVQTKGSFRVSKAAKKVKVKKAKKPKKPKAKKVKKAKKPKAKKPKTKKVKAAAKPKKATKPKKAAKKATKPKVVKPKVSKAKKAAAPAAEAPKAE